MSELTERALAAAGDAIIVIDTEGIIRAWNAKSEELFGFTASEALGQPVGIMIPEKLRPLHDRAFDAAMASGHLASDGHARRTKAVRPDGSNVYVVMTFAVVTDDEGAALGSVAVAREWVRDKSSAQPNPAATTQDTARAATS